MCALKVSLAFLEGPVDVVITEGTRIATSMNENKYFPIPPISPAGLQSVIDTLKEIETKNRVKKPNRINERDMALEDVRDFIVQNASYVEHASKNDAEILLSSGFEIQ